MRGKWRKNSRKSWCSGTQDEHRDPWCTSSRTDGTCSLSASPAPSLAGSPGGCSIRPASPVRLLMARWPASQKRSYQVPARRYAHTHGPLQARCVGGL